MLNKKVLFHSLYGWGGVSLAKHKVEITGINTSMIKVLKMMK
jgi:hypothetical protein